jgi:hypothetical protein
MVQVSAHLAIISYHFLDETVTLYNVSYNIDIRNSSCSTINGACFKLTPFPVLPLRRSSSLHLALNFCQGYWKNRPSQQRCECICVFLLKMASEGRNM